jgi:hypothetical protein
LPGNSSEKEIHKHLQRTSQVGCCDLIHDSKTDIEIRILQVNTSYSSVADNSLQGGDGQQSSSVCDRGNAMDGMNEMLPPLVN